MDSNFYGLAVDERAEEREAARCRIHISAVALFWKANQHAGRFARIVQDEGAVHIGVLRAKLDFDDL
jgi:hypothetical protein